MGLPRRRLREGETIALDVRPHWRFFAGPLSAGVPVAAFLVGVLQLSGDAETAGLYALAAMAAVWGLWLAGRLARWSTIRFVVTSDRLVHRHGMLPGQGWELPLGQVSDVTAHQTLTDRALRCGALLVRAEDGTAWTVDHLPRPTSLQREIHRQIEHRGQLLDRM